MFEFLRKPKTGTNYQELADALRTQMFAVEGDSPEYETLLKQLERIEKLQTLAQERKVRRQISADALLGAVVTVGCVVIVANWEFLHAQPSKALGFIPK